MSENVYTCADIIILLHFRLGEQLLCLGADTNRDENFPVIYSYEKILSEVCSADFWT